MKIPINKIGKIVAGLEAGRYVKLLDHTDDSGGYLILTAASSDMQTEAFDSWVESMAEVSKFFEESKWTVEW